MPPGKLDGDLASSVIQTNYFSLRALTTLLTPLLNPGARVVNVSSTLGTLSGNSYSEALKDRFRKAASEGGKPEQVDELMQEFVDGAQNGSLAKSGWTTEKNADSISASLAYNVSKSGLSALTQALHNQHAGKQNIEWSSCCPGYVKTDLTRGGGFLTVDQGAKTPVKLALDDVLPEGGFWRQEKPAEWM
jgi:carbonyl reductase 1